MEEAATTKPSESELLGKRFSLTRMEQAFASERTASIHEAAKKAQSLMAFAAQKEDDMLKTLRQEAIERLGLPARSVLKFSSDPKTGVPVSFEVVEILPEPTTEKTASHGAGLSQGDGTEAPA